LFGGAKPTKAPRDDGTALDPITSGIFGKHYSYSKIVQYLRIQLYPQSLYFAQNINKIDLLQNCAN